MDDRLWLDRDLGAPLSSEVTEALTSTTVTVGAAVVTAFTASETAVVSVAEAAAAADGLSQTWGRS